jgi:hypothetical protein
VRVYQTKAEWLSLAEVQVWSHGVNVAFSGIASQIATGFGGDSARAIDGNTDGNWNDGSVTHSATNNAYNWWQVDLGATYQIDQIGIFNRTDGWGFRLSDFSVVVFNQAPTAADTYQTITAAADASLLPVVGQIGNDIILATGSNETLIGSGGYDTYRVGTNFGHTTINNLASDGVTTARGEIDFGAGITGQKLWFLQNGNDLQVDLMGTTDHLTVAGWYAGNARAQTQSFDTADGLKLDSQVAQLVSAMASFSSANPGFDPTTATQVPNDPALQGVVAAAWHA